MRKFRLFAIIGFIIAAVYVWLTRTYEEEKVFVVEKEIPYPIEKVFPQFENLQNFTKWNTQFILDKKYKYTYFQPYEGEGSAISFRNPKNENDFGQIYIRSLKINKAIQYEFYKKNDKMPYIIKVSFLPKGEKTKLTWNIEVPKITLMDSFLDLVTDEDIEYNIGQSMKGLINLLSGKIEKDVMISQIKYDSIMIEEQEERLLLGLNVSTNNQKGNLFKNINLNHNKLISFLEKDLSKSDDEFGLPILLTEAGSLKNKEISYFYGVPLPKEEKISDHNFIFRKQNKAKIYTIYYKGKYENRRRSIENLANRIKKDSLKNGMLEELFVEEPNEEKDVILKISLPVYK